jgi:ring-1,2-phenylacetyl-CoA epoxidase subunit PaaD
MVTAVTARAPSPDRVAEVDRQVRAILDPEIPVITIDDLGIVRGVEVGPDPAGGAEGLVTVTITPTYSGCPAMQAIADAIDHTVARLGMRAAVVTVLSPAWTTDWMSEAGKEALRRFGIAPPTGTRPAGPVAVGLSVRQVSCPQCGSADTEELSRFGSTACKALRRCRECREPFEEFKSI